MDNIEALNKELVCVLFPGNVKNEEKAIQYLGGLKTISQVCSPSSKKHLSLSFQPDNPYVNKINGDVKAVAGVLLKVKVKKTKEDGKLKREVVNTSVVGQVKKIHKFESVCDFQYLPVSNGPNSECLLEKLIPGGLDEPKFLDEPAPFHIVPSSFTRFDKPINYSYTDKKINVTEEELLNADPDEVHKMRSDRGIPVRRFSFNLVDEIPTEPHEYFVNIKNSKASTNPQINEEYEIVQKMFDERPVWSFNHVKHHTRIRTVNLKVILPCIAFHNLNGPWKLLWVKFGYDPRKEPYARYYQMLDFRLRNAGIYSCVSQDLETVKRDRMKKMPLEEPSEEIIPEGALYLTPNSLPTQRQIFYMYCDIHLPEVQEILAVEPPSGYQCHPKRGWLAANTAHTCRDIIFKYLKKNLMGNKHADLKFEQASSEDSESDEATSAPDTTAEDSMITN
ncbi:general transcription factor 3C polypeptide 5 [Pieris rapae]|uniref:general transcription factor 3C polypeptide 5 n=1 Tax=Pieris rapae TaxID=64459 RepID=UPI000B92A122|nr:general transcription factor 3C polypeptide 5 [Pieris rapae]